MPRWICLPLESWVYLTLAPLSPTAAGHKEQHNSSGLGTPHTFFGQYLRVFLGILVGESQVCSLFPSKAYDRAACRSKGWSRDHHHVPQHQTTMSYSSPVLASRFRATLPRLVCRISEHLTKNHSRTVSQRTCLPVSPHGGPQFSHMRNPSQREANMCAVFPVTPD